MTTKFTAGQALFRTTSGVVNRAQVTVLKEEPVTITRVGRKWAELDDRSRFDVKTLKIDNRGFGQEYRVYLSREDYDTERTVTRLWRDLGYRLQSYQVPPYMTVQTLRAIFDLLDGATLEQIAEGVANSRARNTPDILVLAEAWDRHMRAIGRVETASPFQMTDAIISLRDERAAFEDLLLGRRPGPKPE